MKLLNTLGTIMKVSVLCTNPEHPIVNHLRDWALKNKSFDISICHKSSELGNGDFLFLISCSEVIKKEILNKFHYRLVIHASDLPKDRGWSPYIWNILEGQNTLTVSLLEASEKVDEGNIWKKVKFEISPTDLIEEINEKLFSKEIELINYALNSYKTIIPSSQDHKKATYRKKRTPADSEINPSLTISEAFNKIRVCDPERYPAFFYLNGEKFFIQLKKSKKY